MNDARVSVPRHQNVHVHLSRDRAERIEVSGWDALVSVDDADLDGGVHDGHG